MAFPPSLNIADLNGSNGFVISGVAAGDYLGASVSSAGDINGDGISDLSMGTSRADAIRDGDDLIFTFDSSDSIRLEDVFSRDGLTVERFDAAGGEFSVGWDFVELGEWG